MEVFIREHWIYEERIKERKKKKMEKREQRLNLFTFRVRTFLIRSNNITQL